MKTMASILRGMVVAAMPILLAGKALANTTATLRVDVRDYAQIATSIERLGSFDGSSVTAWDTTALADGWTTLSSGGVSTNVLVLNGTSVVGGRLSQNESWDSGCVRVVRHDVVVPSGITLSIGAGAIVKFTAGAKIVVEDGGEFVADGALLADFADDAVGGDTNMDGGDTTSITSWGDWTDGVATDELARVVFIDGASSSFPARAYTFGRPLGTLPEPSRTDARFLGWRTAPDGGGDVVSSATTATTLTATLYASWEAYSLELSPVSTNLAAAAVDCAFAVAANAAWTISTDNDWIAPMASSGSGNGQVLLSVAVNTSTSPRTGTVRVTLAEGGLARDFTIAQEGMESVATPVITPADGTTFRASAQRVAIRCATSGATIRYTLDGTEPTEFSALYRSSGFNIFDTTTIKAKAFKNGMLASGTVSVRLVRLQTLAEALDVPLWTVTTDGNAEWVIDVQNAADGAGASARSGAISHDETTSLRTSVEGSGTLAFLWKASCEDDPDDTWTWDYLVFEADGVALAHLDGQTGWREVSVNLGNGAHTLEWTFAKDFMDGDNVGDDCGWVDRVSWTPTVAVGDAAIPVSWFDDQGLVALGGTAEAAASSDPDGDGLTTAEEYVAGTDPNDSDSTFAANIKIVDGKHVMTWTPDLLGERSYRILGSKSLDANVQWDDVTDIDDPGAEGYRFFKATVTMP